VQDAAPTEEVQRPRVHFKEEAGAVFAVPVNVYHGVGKSTCKKN
jgi:hypothetical protein